MATGAKGTTSGAMTLVDGWCCDNDGGVSDAKLTHIDALPPTPIPKLAMAVDDVVDSAVAEEIYAYSTALGRPWGVYLTLHGRAGDPLHARLLPGSKAMDGQEVDIARRTVGQFWLERLASLLAPIEGQVHGFEVWVLVGDEGSKCDYHLDFAESYRLDDNHIATPIYSSCLHPSPLNVAPDACMEGGDFACHLDGLEHYRRHGHKYRMSSPAEAAEDWETSAGWVKLRYRHRRGVVFDGSLPHLSTPVRSLPENVKRLVVGINVYDHVAGEKVQDCPVHSQKQREDHMYTMLREDLFGE